MLQILLPCDSLQICGLHDIASALETEANRREMNSPDTIARSNCFSYEFVRLVNLFADGLCVKSAIKFCNACYKRFQTRRFSEIHSFVLEI